MNIHQKPLGRKTSREVKKLKTLLASVGTRVEAAEGKLVKRKQAIVDERAEIAKLEAEPAKRQEDERRQELLQLVTRYRTKTNLTSAIPEKRAAQQLLVHYVRSLLFVEKRWTVLILRRRSSGHT